MRHNTMHIHPWSAIAKPQHDESHLFAAFAAIVLTAYVMMFVSCSIQLSFTRPIAFDSTGGIWTVKASSLVWHVPGNIVTASQDRCV